VATQIISAAATASATTTLTSWWLKNPLNPAQNIAVTVVDGHPTSQTERAATHYPLGSNSPAIVSDVVTGRDGQLTVLTTTATAYTALVAIVTSQQTVLMQSPFGEQWYARLGFPSGGSSSTAQKASTLAPSSAANPYRKTQITYVEVAAP